MDFYSSYAQGFARVAACTLPVSVADPERNADAVVAQVRELHDDGVALAIFPELGLSGYAIDDLLLQDPLLDAVDDAIARVAEATAGLRPVVVVGAPLGRGSRLYNCAVVIHDGAVIGVAPKSYLPTYREFYERRHFAPGDDQRGQTIEVAGDRVPFGPDLLFRATDVPGFVVHVEVCEDLWVPVPPSHEAALAGATVLANISGSPITVARAEDRHLLARSASARCLAAYLYAAAGEGESSTDLSWDGMTMVYENGGLLAESERFPEGARASVADIDLDLLRQERQRQGTFDDNRRTLAARTDGFRTIELELDPPTDDIGLLRRVDRFPFVPDDEARLALDCYEAYNIQVSGLEQRLTGHRVADDRHRGQRWPRQHACAHRRGQGDGPARAAPQRHPRLHDARLRDEQPHEGQRDRAHGVPRRHLAGARHPSSRDPDAAGDGPPLRPGRGGLRRHLRERPGRPAHRLPLPHRQPARRHRARHR